MKNYSCLELFDGVVGNVMSDDEFDEKYGIFEIDFGVDVVCEVSEFDFDGVEYIDLSRGDGYRGEGCYEGIVKKNNKLYYFDIMSDGVVYEFNE